MAKPTQNEPMVWSEFNGLSDSLWSGIKGSLYKCVGLDIHSQRGSITPNQALAKDSGATITDLCKVGLAVSDGSRLWFSATSGKIWRESAGTYTLVYTTSPSGGNAGCLGAEEFNGNIYWATQSYLHYCTVSTISNFGGAVPNFQAFGIGNTSFHPMEVANNALFIGDDHTIAKVDSANAFTAKVLDFGKPIVVKCMVAFDIDLVIGTIIDTTVGFCYIVEWDTIQTSWQFMENVWENGINSLFWDGSTLLANAGQYGKIYYYSGHQLKPYKRVPAGTWTPTSNGEILPNAAGMWNGLCVFGFSMDNGNPCDAAVYTLGSYDKDYTPVINEDFPISSGNFTNITIGAIVVSGQNLFVSWQDTGAGTQGVDKLDFTNLYTAAYLETPVIARDLDGETQTVYGRMFANWKSMPASTAIAFSYYQNWGSKTAAGSTIVKDPTNQVWSVDEGIVARVFRMRVDFTVSGNSGPVLESFGVTTPSK